MLSSAERIVCVFIEVPLLRRTIPKFEAVPLRY